MPERLGVFGHPPAPAVLLSPGSCLLSSVSDSSFGLRHSSFPLGSLFRSSRLLPSGLPCYVDIGTSGRTARRPS